MKTIFFARHSYTENPYNIEDFDRTLTREGYTRISEQIGILKSKSEKIDLIVSSSALRAKQTAIELKEKFNIKSDIIFIDWLYESYLTQDLLELFQATSEQYQNIILIAHNPTLSYMATNFNHSKNYAFNPFSILKLEFDIDSWKRVDVRAGRESYYLF